MYDSPYLLYTCYIQCLYIHIYITYYMQCTLKRSNRRRKRVERVRFDSNGILVRLDSLACLITSRVSTMFPRVQTNSRRVAGVCRRYRFYQERTSVRGRERYCVATFCRPRSLSDDPLRIFVAFDYDRVEIPFL